MIVHRGFYPETLNNVFFSLAIHIDGEPYQFERMVLYFHPADGYRLVPEKRGPFIALEEAGKRGGAKSERPHFSDWCRRTA
jgi:hypothetical protein